MSQAQTATLNRLDFPFEIKAVDAAQRIISGYAAIFNIADQGNDTIDPAAFNATLTGRPLTDIKVFIGHHGENIPVGYPLVVRPDAKGLYTETKVLSTSAGDDLLKAAAELQTVGAPLGMSIGYRPDDFAVVEMPGGQWGRRLKSLYLGEFSYVGMPMHLMAGVTSVKTLELDTKTAIPVHHTKTDTSGTWDGQKAMADAPNDAAVLRYMCAAVDSGADPEAKSSYHLPHHEGHSGAPAVIRGVNNALARLSSTHISDADKAGAKAHLEAHRKDAGLDTEKGADLALMEIAVEIADLSEAASLELMAMHQLGMETKAGARMQAPMRARLKACMDHLSEIMAWAEKADMEPDDDDKANDHDADDKGGKPNDHDVDDVKAWDYQQYAYTMANLGLTPAPKEGASA